MVVPPIIRFMFSAFAAFSVAPPAKPDVRRNRIRGQPALCRGRRRAAICSWVPSRREKRPPIRSNRRCGGRRPVDEAAFALVRPGLPGSNPARAGRTASIPKALRAWWTMRRPGD